MTVYKKKNFLVKSKCCLIFPIYSKKKFFYVKLNNVNNMVSLNLVIEDKNTIFLICSLV